MPFGTEAPYGQEYFTEVNNWLLHPNSAAQILREDPLGAHLVTNTFPPEEQADALKPQPRLTSMNVNVDQQHAVVFAVANDLASYPQAPQPIDTKQYTKTITTMQSLLHAAVKVVLAFQKQLERLASNRCTSATRELPRLLSATIAINLVTILAIVPSLLVSCQPRILCRTSVSASS